MSVVYIGIPVLDGKPHYATVDSLLAEQFLAAEQGIHLLVDWEVGCSLIGDARNRIAKRFLASKCKDLVFVDADISWPAGALVRLVKNRHPVIGGTYRAKQDEVRFHVHGKALKKGSLYQVGGLPGGFIKISRKALLSIKPRAYGTPEDPTFDYFPMGFHRGVYYGEDYGFCRQYRAAGGKVWLDPSIHLRHHDGMTAYAGDPRLWLEGKS